MKKVLIMNDLVVGGGAEKVLWEVINILLDNKYDVTLITPKKYEVLPNKSIKYVYFSNQDGRCEYLKKAIKIVKVYLKIYKENYDFAIAMKEGRCMKYVRWMRAKRKFAWIHVDYDYLYYTKNKFKFIPEINYMKKFEKIFCVSRQVKKSVVHKVGNPNNLTLLYNPIDIDNIVKKSFENVEDFYCDSQKKLFVSVGRLSYEKGYDRLIMALVKLKDIEEKFEVLIIGEGTERENLERLIKEYHLHNITLLGKRDNPYKYIRIANYFVNVSRTESFGLSIYEALLCGKPCMITDCSGSKELFCEEKHGWIVENSIEGIYKGMRSLIINPQEKNNLDTKIIEEKCNKKNILKIFM